ncbi:MAG: ABC transporter permease, partial [Acidobacteria bacterium]|nr:ABC transporter permease [Acidobacteriota bacterium]
MKDGLALRLALRLHRLSLRPFPPGFRRRFEAEMQACFEELARERSRRGLLSLLHIFLLATSDNLRSARAERRHAERCHSAVRRQPTPRAPEEAFTMTSILRDLQVALRMLASRPTFAAVAVLTLALGIGSNTAIFSVIEGVLLSPLQFPEPDRLVRLFPSRSGADAGKESPASVHGESLRSSFSLPDFRDWERESRALEAAGLFTTLPSGPLYTGGAEPAEVPTAYVTAGFFEALGHAPSLGRTPSREEETEKRPVVVVSHGFWERVLGGDPEVAGRTLQLDDLPFEVVGVMPEGFGFPTRETELWMFLEVIPEQSIPLQLRQVRFLEAVGRLAPGVSRQQAEEELSVIAASLEEAHPETNATLSSAQLEGLSESLTGSVSRQLVLLLSASGLVLLLACANLAHLLLARGVERQREMAVRTALGAGRGRLLRQLLTESTLLSLLGGAVGVVLVGLSLPVLMKLAAEVLPRAAEVRLDGRVLAYAAASTLGTGLLFGLLPAWRSIRGGTALFSSGARVSGQGRRRLNLLIVGETAAALLLVIAAALLGRSLWALQSVDPGFDAGRLLAVSLTINDARYPERSQYMNAYHEILA